MTTNQSELPVAPAVSGTSDLTTCNALVVVSPQGAQPYVKSQAVSDLEATFTRLGAGSRCDAPDPSIAQTTSISRSDVAESTVDATDQIDCSTPQASAPSNLEVDLESLGKAAELMDACNSLNGPDAEVTEELPQDEQVLEQRADADEEQDAELTLLERLDRRQDHVLDELEHLNQRVKALMKQIQAEREFELRDDDQALTST